ncbi:hypothetical protein EV401DRAFT_1894669 [Pisolithus croceorrhizus]|nr:hypothetical protein EV401DRAFT_1894669 [Pisolithus croceorrhizus]
MLLCVDPTDMVMVPSGRYHELPSQLDVCMFTKVMVTQNVQADLDITNGARGKVIDIIVELEEAAVPPLCALKLNGLDRNVIPVEATPARRSKSKPRTSRGNNNNRTARCRQLPMTAAYSFIEYCSQGQTLPWIKPIQLTRGSVRKYWSFKNQQYGNYFSPFGNYVGRYTISCIPPRPLLRDIQRIPVRSAPDPNSHELWGSRNPACEIIKVMYLSDRGGKVFSQGICRAYHPDVSTWSYNHESDWFGANAKPPVATITLAPCNISIIE